MEVRVRGRVDSFRAISLPDAFKVFKYKLRRITTCNPIEAVITCDPGSKL